LLGYWLVEKVGADQFPGHVKWWFSTYGKVLENVACLSCPVGGAADA
jgi:hypothetical protein